MLKSLIRVWLLCDDGPRCEAVESELILLDVKVPVLVEVSREVDGAQAENGLSHGWSVERAKV